MSREEILKQLQAIQDSEGRITPKAIVNAARPNDSSLHGLFIWDDRLAGEQYRIDQARTLLRVVRIDIQINSKIIRATAYARDPALSSNEQGYRSITALRADSSAAAEAVLAEFRRAESILRRARDFAYVLGFSGEIEQLLDRMQQIAGVVSGSAPDDEATV